MTAIAQSSVMMMEPSMNQVVAILIIERNDISDDCDKSELYMFLGSEQIRLTREMALSYV